jgi:hypothetical protein
MATTKVAGGVNAKVGGSRKAPSKKPIKPEVFRAGVWCCPKCHNLIEIMVKMTVKPSCCNHIGGAVVEMERVGK